MVVPGTGGSAGSGGAAAGGGGFFLQFYFIEIWLSCSNLVPKPQCIAQCVHWTIRFSRSQKYSPVTITGEDMRKITNSEFDTHKNLIFAIVLLGWDKYML